MPAPYRFQRGEDIRILLAILGDSSEAANVIGVTAVLKAAVNGFFVPSPATPAVASFDIVPNLVPADGSTPGWFLTLTATQCAQLEPGSYVTQAVLAHAGNAVEITDPLVIIIQQSTSA